MPTYRGGRHEHGQNFLTDTRIQRQILEYVSRTDGPIIEVGPGDGALTLPMESLRRTITAIEVDSHLAAALRRRAGPQTTVLCHDVLTFHFPERRHVVVGNLPFHLTTAILRRLLHLRSWSTAVLLVQWEVARRRAGVGGATMMTAQWWPWYTFHLEGRVPARAFRPAPGVDGGILRIERRPSPLVAAADRGRYRAFVHGVFTGPGRDLEQILRRRGLSRAAVRAALGKLGIARTALPREVSAEQWARLFGVAGSGRQHMS